MPSILPTHAPTRGDTNFGALHPQVDDLADPALARGGREVLRAATIGAGERLLRGHRMNEVIGDPHAREGLVQRVRLEDVSVNDLRLLSRPSRQRLGSPHHAAHQSPRFLELPQQPAADVTGRPGKQNAPHRWGRSPSHACEDAHRESGNARERRHPRIGRPRSLVTGFGRA